MTALEQLRALRNEEKNIKAQIETVKPQAETEARNITKQGMFQHNGHNYILDREDVFDFIAKPQKYTMPEGVTYRQKFLEQKQLKSQSAAITKLLKSIKDAFPSMHPNIQPDEVNYTVKCLD